MMLSPGVLAISTDHGQNDKMKLVLTVLIPLDEKENI